MLHRRKDQSCSCWTGRTISKGITDFLISDPQLQDLDISVHQKTGAAGRQ
jgi:hypothetical protein